MKNLLTLVLLFAALSASAQRGDEKGEQIKREQIKSLKTAFITSELSLTSDEAAKFWPIYNAFDEKQFELKHQKMRTLGKKMDEIDSMSDKEALAVINQMDDYEEELLQNRRKLVSSLKSVISPVKILKLKMAEDNFNRKLLRQYREKGPKK